jgi:hypothetical protein
MMIALFSEETTVSEILLESGFVEKSAKWEKARAALYTQFGRARLQMQDHLSRIGAVGGYDDETLSAFAKIIELLRLYET